MRTSRAGEAAFVGRARLLTTVRQSVESGLNVWLKGESGVGKTALARRAAPSAFYVAHCSPVKEVLVSLLVDLYGKGLYLLDEDEDEEADEEKLRRKFKRLDTREALKSITEALTKAEKDTGARPIVIFDEFETATATIIRAIRQIAGVATVVCCSPEAKPAQKPFLTTCTRVEVPRLTKSESEKLVEKLLDDYPDDDISARERPRLLRQIVEQAQGVPAIARELVKRAAARGDLSLSAVRREDLHGAKPLDMTPGLLILGIVVVGWRVAMRPLHDADMTVLIGFSGAILMIVRLFAFRITNRSARR